MSKSTEAYRRYDVPPVTETGSEPAVAGLMWSPLKSGQSVYVDQLYVSPEGMKPTQESTLSDRSLMIIDARHPEGKLVSQRDKARLALLETKVDGDSVTLIFHADQAADKLKAKLPSAEPSSYTFTITLEADEAHLERSTLIHTTSGIKGIDQGDEVARWLSEIVGQPVRLVVQKLTNPRTRKETAPGYDNLVTMLRFQDSFPLTALSYTTLDMLNQRLNVEQPEWPQFAPMNFRMNILFSGAINEHLAVGKFLKIGEVYFYIYRPKERCPMPAVDPDTGVLRGEAGFGSRYQQLLASMHDELGIPDQWRMKEVGKGDTVRLEPKPSLGVDLIPLNAGYISVDDKVEILDEPPAGIVI